MVTHASITKSGFFQQLDPEVCPSWLRERVAVSLYTFWTKETRRVSSECRAQTKPSGAASARLVARVLCAGLEVRPTVYSPERGETRNPSD